MQNMRMVARGHIRPAWRVQEVLANVPRWALQLLPGNQL